MSTDAPYPELKKTHTMVRTGRPWRDRKPPPSAPVWAVIQGYVNYWVLVAALDLGLFDALDAAGTLAVDQLAQQLGTDTARTQDLVDALIVLGFVDALPGAVSTNETAERYLTRTGAASMAALVSVANGPHGNWPRLAETIRTGVPPAPIDDDPVPFYRPLIEATFPTQMRAAGRLAARLGIERQPGLRMLDLGAGGAPWSLAWASLSTGATIVANDLPGVIEFAETQADALSMSHCIELRSGDFHRIDIEASSYDVVFLCHICRAEGAAGTRSLLARAGRALVPGGTLVVADYARGATRTSHPFAALMGITLVASTRNGTTFTGPELVAWIGEAGFTDIRFHEPIGGQFAYTAQRSS
jgi:2-polyprenyl-3-methyl-5-hydroxy-6-metoxy-1,4-benzoquinol methylase